MHTHKANRISLFSSAHAKHSGRGFSIIEIAVVLVILSILLAVVAIPLATQVNQRRISETQQILENAQKALVGFASASGRLPCPAIDGPSGSMGDEAFATGGDAANGRCAQFVGFLPAVALGLSPVDSQGFAIDGWGIQQNRIRYAVWGSSVTQINAVSYPFTKTNGMREAQANFLADASKAFLYVCRSAPLGSPLPNSSVANTGNVCGTGVVKLTDKSPAVIFSLGANAATGGTGPDELHNVNQDFVFVSHDPTPAGSASGEFDDIVTWISLNTLFDRMLQAGKLP